MHRGPFWKEILWSQLWLVSNVPRPNGGGGLSHFQYRTSTTQTAEDNDMNNDWGLLLQQTLSYSSPHSCAHHPCLSCGFLPSLQLAERGIGVCTVRSIREVGFGVWVWAGQRSVWVSSVSSFRSANQQWRICCLYCSELWQSVGLLGCGIARSESSTFAVGRKVRGYNTGMKTVLYLWIRRHSSTLSPVFQHCWCQTAEALLLVSSSPQFPSSRGQHWQQGDAGSKLLGA